MERRENAQNLVVIPLICHLGLCVILKVALEVLITTLCCYLSFSKKILCHWVFKQCSTCMHGNEGCKCCRTLKFVWHFVKSCISIAESVVEGWKLRWLDSDTDLRLSREYDSVCHSLLSTRVFLNQSSSCIPLPALFSNSQSWGRGRSSPVHQCIPLFYFIDQTKCYTDIWITVMLSQNFRHIFLRNHTTQDKRMTIYVQRRIHVYA